MKKFIVAAAVIGVASLAGIKSAEAQAPSRVGGGGYGTYPGTYGTYPSQYPNQYPTTEHARKHHKKSEARERDGDADDAQYGQYGGQYGTYGYPNSTYGYPNGTYGYPNGTYGYPSSSAPSRVQPNGGYGTYNERSRVLPQRAHSRDRDHDRRRNERDR
jgi:hypothetical protein